MRLHSYILECRTGVEYCVRYNGMNLKNLDAGPETEISAHKCSHFESL